jgi:aspartate-semialdehyde dehydrogenase
MNVAVIGSTGLVGSTMIDTLIKRNFPVTTLIPVASAKSVGSEVKFKDKQVAVVSMEEAVKMQPDIVLFSAGGQVSLDWAEAFAYTGAYVIDNSSAWRMDPTKKLIVPEVNANVLTPEDRIIANPNCSTIQMVVVLKPLHDAFGINRVVVSTYQSVTGSGQKGVDQLQAEQAGTNNVSFYPHQIHMNVLPHIDVFLDNGYTKEEMKMILETKKILGNDNIAVTATTVRVPVMGGHSESVNISFDKAVTLEGIYNVLENAPGVIVHDNPKENQYPMPLDVYGKDEVYVGRIRLDDTLPSGMNCWIVADNLKKGAATNAVQIAEYIANQGWVK